MKIEEGPKHQKILDALAFIVSALFSPYFVAALLILIFSYIYAENFKQFLPWLLIGIVFLGLIPAMYLVWLLEKKQVSDLHLSKHKDRLKPFAMGAVSSIIGVLILSFVGAARPVMAIALAYSLSAIAVTIITWYWKISIHSALFAASIYMILVFLGKVYWPLSFFWIPLAWARVHRKKHTPLQVLGGAIVALLICGLVFYLFGYKLGDK